MIDYIRQPSPYLKPIKCFKPMKPLIVRELFDLNGSLPSATLFKNQISIKKLVLKNTFQTLLPDFFNPALKLFPLSLAWSSKNHPIDVSPAPQKNILDNMLILGAQNQRKLIPKEWNDYPAQNCSQFIKLIVWVLELNCNIYQIPELLFDVNAIIQTSPLPRYSNLKPKLASTHQYSKKLEELTLTIKKQNSSITNIYPILDLSADLASIRHRPSLDFHHPMVDIELTNEQKTEV